jgi:glycosyltransferase involved in cell wall biosynthesis
MNDEIKVSVCCLAYNHEKYIREAIESFVQQKTDFRYEILVNDDCSSDNTRKIIEECEIKYPGKVRGIYHNENQYSKGINVFFSNFSTSCKGEYIAICEGDDFWTSEDKLQKQVDFLDRNKDYSLCVHNTKILNLYNGTTKLFNRHDCEYDIEMDDIIKWDQNLFHASSEVFRTEFLPQMPRYCFNTKAGDYPFALYLRTQGKIRYLPEVMSVYRYGVEGSYTDNMKSSDIIASYLQEHIDMLKKFNICTDNEFELEVSKKIKALEVEKMKMEGCFKKILRKEYKETIKNMPIKSKIAIIIGLISPRLYNNLAHINR